MATGSFQLSLPKPFSHFWLLFFSPFKEPLNKSCWLYLQDVYQLLTLSLQDILIPCLINCNCSYLVSCFPIRRSSQGEPVLAQKTKAGCSQWLRVWPLLRHFLSPLCPLVCSFPSCLSCFSYSCLPPCLWTPGVIQDLCTTVPTPHPSCSR